MAIYSIVVLISHNSGDIDATEFGYIEPHVLEKKSRKELVVITSCNLPKF